MSESSIEPIPQQDRLLQALMQVTRDVAEDVIKRAQMTHTPVIVADEEGNILYLDPDDLIKQLGDNA